MDFEHYVTLIRHHRYSMKRVYVSSSDRPCNAIQMYNRTFEFGIPHDARTHARDANGLDPVGTTTHPDQDMEPMCCFQNPTSTYNTGLISNWKLK